MVEEEQDDGLLSPFSWDKRDMRVDNFLLIIFSAFSVWYVIFFDAISHSGKTEDPVLNEILLPAFPCEGSRSRVSTNLQGDSGGLRVRLG